MTRPLRLALAALLVCGQAWAGQPPGITPNAANQVPNINIPLYTQLWQVGCNRSGTEPASVAVLGQSRQAQYMGCGAPYGARAVRILLPASQQVSSGAFAYSGEFPLPDGVFTVDSIKSIVAGGSNYQAGDYIVEAVQGIGIKPAVIMVDAVSSGAVTAAHVVVGGTYTTQLADGSTQAAIWQKGAGFGFHAEGIVNSGALASIYTGMYSGGMLYTTSNTTLSVLPTACAGTSNTPTTIAQTGAIILINPVGYSGCASTTNPTVDANTGTAPLGSGATFSFNWKGAAYAVRVSIDPTFGNQTCVVTSINSCQHRTVTSSDGSLNTSLDYFGYPADIFVRGNGADVLTDPVQVNVAPGGRIGIRLYGVGNLPTGRLTQLPGEQVVAGLSTPDYTQGLSFATTAATQNRVLQPKAVLVQPVTPGPALLAIGDSRAYGRAGLGSASNIDIYDQVNGAVGWIERTAALAGMPIINHSRSADTMYSWITNRSMRLAALRKIATNSKFPEICYLNLSVNDYTTGGFTYAQELPFEAQMVQDMRGLGCKFVFTDTTDPYETAAGGGTGLAWADITSGGSGYPASSTFNVTVLGGTSAATATLSVTTNASGVVTTVNSVVPGQYSANPTSTNACAANVCLGALPVGGGGTGLTVTLYMTGFTPSATLTQLNGTASIMARNAQLRSPNMGDFAGIYDNFLDWNGIAEAGAGSANWVAYSVVDGLHITIPGLMAKAAMAAPLVAQWAKIAAAR